MTIIAKIVIKDTKNTLHSLTPNILSVFLKQPLAFSRNSFNLAKLRQSISQLITIFVNSLAVLYGKMAYVTFICYIGVYMLPRLTYLW